MTENKCPRCGTRFNTKDALVTAPEKHGWFIMPEARVLIVCATATPEQLAAHREVNEAQEVKS